MYDVVKNAVNYYHDLTDKIDRLKSEPKARGIFDPWVNRIRRKRIDKLYIYRAGIYVQLTTRLGIDPIKTGRLR